MAAQLGGTASFQPTIFLKTSKNLSTVFISLSVILLVVLSALIVNDFIQYEITELTVYTTEKITVIVYFLHLVGFYAALIALVWINETTHKRHRIPRVTLLLMMHVFVFLARMACELSYVNYRPEFYREVDDGDFESPYCDAIINL